ncbi:MAG: HAD family hydrolase [Candidatus Spechtbacterales bacterium]
MKLKLKIKLIAFDVNGTILNDFDIFSNALNSIFDYFKKPRMSEVQFRDEFTQPWTDIYRKRGILEDVASEKFLYTLYNKAYQAQDDPKPFSDLEPVLKQIQKRGLTTAIITTQQNIITDALLNKYDLGKYFDFHLGGVADKTKALQKLIEKVNIQPKQTMYIGDQDSDMRFAKNASCIAVGFTGGTHSKQKLQKAGADYIIDNFTELVNLLDI